MKIFLTFELLPKLQQHFFHLGREHKYLFVARRIIILLFAFTTLLTAQNINNNDLPDAYKNVYIWNEKENYYPTDDSVLTVLGRWAWGPCLAVDADSNFAYIGNGPTFHVLDITNPSSPTIVGEYLTEGYIYDIEIRENTAFLCIGRWFLILDVSDPFNPTNISDLIIATNDAAISFALDNDFAYVTTFLGLMWVVDISDLSNPVKRNGIAAGGQLAYCVDSKNRYVYIGNPEYPPMVIVDATNPDSLTRVDFEVGGWGYSISIKDTLLFVGVHGYTGTNYFKIYDVSNAMVPQFLGEVGFMPPEDVMAITISKEGQTAYVRTTTGNIYSIDITDLTQPEIIDGYEKRIGTIFGNTGIAVQNNSILSAHYIGLLNLDALQPDSLTFQSFFQTGGTALELDSKDSLVFVACGLSGLWILNISNPDKPETVSNVMTNGFTADIVVEDSLAFIVNWAAYSEQDTSRGLWIINNSDIAQPKIVSHYVGITNFSTNTEPNSISKSSGLIFITQQPRTGVDSILEIIDVSDIYQPKRLGVFISDYYPKSTTVKDTILFLATHGSGLRMINIRNPLQPVEVNVFRDSSNISITDVYDDLLYADKSDTFFVLNISNPVEPTIWGRCGKTEQGSALNLIATENYVYSAGFYLTVFDVTDKTNPNDISRFESYDYGRDIDIYNDKIIFSDGASGLWILKNNLILDVNEITQENPVQYYLHQNYPNPFNPTTTIEFMIPTREKVLIEVFNVLGQKIQTILDREIEAGKHTIEFHSFGLSSGIYFYRMRTKEITITKKMVILR
jgi:hypothetical protein